jgi:hypothetical protein
MKRLSPQHIQDRQKWLTLDEIDLLELIEAFS